MSATVCSVVSKPVTTHGWRPISVVYQPATVANQPEKPIKTNPRKYHGFKALISWPRRLCRQVMNTPAQDTNSINMPRPTMIRNDQKTGMTGGV